MKQFLRLLPFLLLAIMTACTPFESGLDAGLLTGTPCGPPCWQNLTPGQSTADDVEHFLAKLSDQEWPEKSTEITSSDCKWFHLTDRPGLVVGAALDLYIKDGHLWFITSVPANTLRLYQLVDHLGPPEYFQALLAKGPETDFYTLEIYYPKKGVAFKLSPDQKDTGQIKPLMPIQAIEYYAPGDLLAYFSTKYSCEMSKEDAIRSAQEQMRLVQPWTDFGQVKVVQTR